MTTFSCYFLKKNLISPHINFKTIFGRILAPPSGRRTGADAPLPPRYATVNVRLVLAEVLHRYLVIA